MWKVLPGGFLAVLALGCASSPGMGSGPASIAFPLDEDDVGTSAHDDAKPPMPSSFEVWPFYTWYRLAGGDATRFDLLPGRDYRLAGLAAGYNHAIAPGQALGPYLQGQTSVPWQGDYDFVVRGGSLGLRYQYHYSEDAHAHLMADGGWMFLFGPGFGYGAAEALPDTVDFRGYTLGAGLGLEIFPFEWFGVGVQFSYRYFRAEGGFDAHWYGVSLMLPFRI